MKKGTIYLTIFAIFAVIFAAALITLALPTYKTTSSTSSALGERNIVIVKAFNIETLTEKPKYAIGLGVIAFLALNGMVFTRYAQKQVDETEKPIEDEETTP